MKLSNTLVNGDRLWSSLMEMATIGPGAMGGSRRLALTDEDKAGRDLFVRWCEQAGCAVTIDDMGNIFARRAGSEAHLAPVAMGSHLDTQPHGGRFDGVYGVLAGLEVIRTLNDHQIQTRAPVEVVCWTNEEGSRFAPAMIASGVFSGLFERDFAYGLTDAQGLRFGDELERIGYRGQEFCGNHPIGAFLEAHIEQGPVLERTNTTIGVVTGAQGQHWYDVLVKGQDSHAGSTPMEGRRDALVAASRMVVELQSLAKANEPHAVGTVGYLDSQPNSRNTVPGEVTFSVDLRHPDDQVLSAMDAALRVAFSEVAQGERCEVEVNRIWHKPPVVFHEGCVSSVREAARDLGLTHLDMVSGAGHDACQIREVAATGMIFVPCAGGLSHNEAESATPEDLAAGCNVMLHALLNLSAGAPDAHE